MSLAQTANLASDALAAGDVGSLDDAVRLGRELLATATDDEQRLAARINLSCDLASRCTLRQSAGDLEEAIDLLEAVETTTVDDRATVAANLASRLLLRYELNGDLDTLQRAIDVVAGIDLPKVDPGTAAIVAANLATAKSILATHTGDIDDLAEAAEGYRDALAILAAGDPRRGGLTANLANALVDLYQSGRGDELLDQAAEALDQNIPLRAADIGRIAQTEVNVHLLRYERDHNPADLDRAVELATAAAKRSEDRSLGHWEVLNALAVALHGRYSHRGDPADLHEAIAVAEAALGAAPQRSPSTPGLVSNYSMMMGSRFELTGNSDDLDRSIDVLSGVLATGDVPLDEQPALLNNLSASLAARFRHSEDLAVYEMADARLRDAINLTPPGSPGLAIRLDALGALAIEAWAQTSVPGHLEASINAGERALDETSPTSADWPRLATNQAARLLIRAEDTGDIGDGRRAASLLDRARSSSPETSQTWATATFHLARALHWLCEADEQLEFDGRSGRNLRQYAVDLWDSCCATGWDDIVIHAARQLGQIATEIGQWPQAKAAFEVALEAADRQTAQRHRRDDAERARRAVQGIGAAAGAVALEMNDAGGSVEALERASAVLLRSALEQRPEASSRTPVSALALTEIVHVAATPLGGFAVAGLVDGDATYRAQNFAPLPALTPEAVSEVLA
ncbi:MAG: hypothetical protein OEV40_14805, partial [Acidimicrobiia bacterium]|nr:hypothetical protein [Acidimicrobiia bacterium]